MAGRPSYAPTKRKLDDPEGEAGPSATRFAASASSRQMSGYICEVSPIKNSKNNNKYFNCKLQTASTHVDHVVCYCPSMHAQFKSLDNDDAFPVTLENVQVSLKGDDIHDIVVTRMTRLNKTNLRFSRRPPSDEVEYHSIADILNSPPVVLVAINASVRRVGPAKQQNVRGQTKMKQELVMADNTGSIQVTVWEQQVGSLTNLHSYRLTKLSAKTYFDNLSLTATPDTTIEASDFELEVEPDDLLPSITKLLAGVEMVAILVTKNCRRCSRAISHRDIGTDSTKCPHCAVRQNTSALSLVAKSEFMLKPLDGTDISSFPQLIPVPQDVLFAFLEASSKMTLLKTVDLLENFFLAAKFHFEIENNNIISIRQA